MHDTHHPLGGGLYYEDQKPEAGRRTQLFLRDRVPKYMGYFETLARPKGTTYLDLSLFQMIDGLRYAFPGAFSRIERKYPKLAALHERVAQRKRLAAYLASERRLPFNEQDLFRRYPELDA